LVTRWHPSPRDDRLALLTLFEPSSGSDQRKTHLMKHYEGMFILHNRDVRGEEDEEPETAEQVVRRLVEKVDGEIVHTMQWANRKLAYPIAGNQTGTYILCYLSGDSTVHTRLNREVNLSDRCLRSMLVAIPGIPAEADLPAPLTEPASRSGRRFEGDVSAETGKDGDETQKIWDLLDYKNPFVLRRMISAQGKLFSRVRSNLQAKSQRRLRTAVFRARNMALLPFVGR
jgi:small subunit ribosomal protein S18